MEIRWKLHCEVVTTYVPTQRGKKVRTEKSVKMEQYTVLLKVTH